MTSDTAQGARSGRPYFGVLDGLRGIAALAVAGYHLPEVFDGRQLVPHGAIAVDFFFMLSGFVIASSYEDRLGDGRLTARRLVAARLIRLMPMAVLGLMLGALALIVGGATAAQGNADLIVQISSGLVLLPYPWPNPISDNIMPLNWPAWSLFFELYVGTALTLLAPRISTRGMAIVVAALAAIYAATAIDAGNYNLGWSPSTVNAGLARFGYTFLIGWMFWRIRIDTVAPKTHPAVVAALLLAILAFPSPKGWNPAFELAAAMVACPLVLALGSACAAQRRWSGASSRLGELSYPLYAVHAPVLLLVGHYGGLSARPIAVPIAIAVAVAALLLYDTPVRRALHARARPLDRAVIGDDFPN